MKMTEIEFARAVRDCYTNGSSTLALRRVFTECWKSGRYASYKAFAACHGMDTSAFMVACLLDSDDPQLFRASGDFIFESLLECAKWLKKVETVDNSSKTVDNLWTSAPKLWISHG